MTREWARSAQFVPATRPSIVSIACRPAAEAPARDAANLTDDVLARQLLERSRT